jgi:hypothetical protein
MRLSCCISGCNRNDIKTAALEQWRVKISAS